MPQGERPEARPLRHGWLLNPRLLRDSRRLLDRGLLRWRSILRRRHLSLLRRNAVLLGGRLARLRRNTVLRWRDLSVPRRNALRGRLSRDLRLGRRWRGLLRRSHQGFAARGAGEVALRYFIGAKRTLHQLQLPSENRRSSVQSYRLRRF